jgi:hypothetical protein
MNHEKSLPDKLSKEELEKIKKENKKPDLASIIASEKAKHDAKMNAEKEEIEEDIETAEEIKKIEEIEENKKEEVKEDNQDSDQKFIFTHNALDKTCKSLKNELQESIEDLENSLKPINNKIRSLGTEVGGLETDYAKSQEKTNQDKDVWDIQAQSIAEAANEEHQARSSQNESFIHNVKTGMHGGRRKRRRRRMGQVNLSAADNSAEQSGKHAEKILKDRNNSQNNKGNSR